MSPYPSSLTGVAPGRYYLVSTANPSSTFIETANENNRAWVVVDLRRDSNGNAKIKVVGDSLTIAGEGIPAYYTTNR